MAELRCHRCGLVGEGDTLDWSSTTCDGERKSLCGSCTRRHVRDIESKLDEQWWATDQT